MEPVFFPSAAAFREWLERYSDSEKELLVGYYKVHTGKPTMTWGESVDEALCFGWIDGVRKSIDEDRYMIRFTPRRAGSIWSAVNLQKMETLIAAGKMTPSGLEAFSKRKENKTAIYSYESGTGELDKSAEKEFRKHKTAWTKFQAMPASYRRAALHWIMTAKQKATKEKRLAALIRDSSEGRRLKHLSYSKK